MLRHANLIVVDPRQEVFGQDRGGWTVGRDPAVLEHADPVRVGGRQAEVVQDHHDSVTSVGAIPHDLAIVGQQAKTKLISSKGSAKLTVTLKPGTYELYCTVPGHKQAGMDLKVKVS